ATPWKMAEITVGTATASVYAIPLWLPLFAAGAGCALARRSLRPARGTCKGCGYDLRGIKGRCPECGRAPVGLLSRIVTLGRIVRAMHRPHLVADSASTLLRADLS